MDKDTEGSVVGSFFHIFKTIVVNIPAMTNILLCHGSEDAVCDNCTTAALVTCFNSEQEIRP